MLLTKLNTKWPMMPVMDILLLEKSLVMLSPSILNVTSKDNPYKSDPKLIV